MKDKGKIKEKNETEESARIGKRGWGFDFKEVDLSK